MKFKLVESFARQRYTYKGPVYNSSGLIAGSSNKETLASSHKEAVNNILGQFYKELGYRPQIDSSLVKATISSAEVTKPVENKPKQEYADGSKQISLF